jgi:hypothetical protein
MLRRGAKVINQRTAFLVSVAPDPAIGMNPTSDRRETATINDKLFFYKQLAGARDG